MKLNTIIFLLSGIILIGFINDKIYGQMSLSLKKYYSNTNNAELSIVDSNYLKAINYYDSAFASKASPFAIDIYNAAVCAVLLNKNEKCYSLLTKIIDKGYKINNFQKKQVFNEFFKTEWGKNLLKYSENINIYYNLKLRHTLDSLFYMDQLFRKKVGEDKPYSFYEDTITKTDISNTKFLNKLIVKYGFPSEDLIGLNDSSLVDQPYYILIIHQQSGSPSRIYDFTSEIINALYDGKINVHNASELITKSCGNDLYGFFNSGIVKAVYDPSDTGKANYGIDKNYDNISWGYFQIPEEKEKKIDSVRQEIGLEKLRENRTKIVFRLKDTLFDFSKFSGENSIFSIPDKEFYEETIKNIIPLK